MNEDETCDAFNVAKQGMCNTPLTDHGNCPQMLNHGCSLEDGR